MDSKQIPEEDLPPPYSISASHNSQDGSITAHLQHNLTSLPNRIRMNQEAHSVQQSLDDASILDLLLPEIDDFLSYLGGLRSAPKFSHLFLIPETAVPPNAVLSRMEDMHKRGELCRVARVRMNMSSDEKKTSSKHDHSQGVDRSQDWSVGREFSDWGRFGDSSSSTDPSQGESMLWWKDEDMAGRLARHLQPTMARDEPAPIKTPVQAIVEERLPAQKEKKGWFRGKKESSSSSTSTFATKTVQSAVESFPGKDNTTLPNTKKTRERENGGAKMSVTAEEVAFRTQNDFGLMESVRGWAVVVVVHVKT
ncbi:hypothetical protein O1611_g5734 [Lasiodiplodia mahajangana]|uniref:Uncharacterized protein n=1 Tax=Lasiodiplodia mahajangana TaxID=1108764 RepID=A0ACC2JKU0_9PEZI|nr:hypothetical protein O1611_g5734 [Lasiodiplodia mahajangana]